MDTWIMWVVGCSVAYWVGQAVGKHVATLNMLVAMSKDPDSFLKMAQTLKKIEDAKTQEELDAELNRFNSESTGTEMTIERVGDQMYAYAKDTGQFLAQAANLDKLLELVNQRFPEQKFFGTISKDNPAKELVK